MRCAENWETPEALFGIERYCAAARNIYQHRLSIVFIPQVGRIVSSVSMRKSDFGNESTSSLIQL